MGDRNLSQDGDKKVRIKLKTDGAKQDPRAVKAPKDKPALKKYGENSTPSPDPSPQRLSSEPQHRQSKEDENPERNNERIDTGTTKDEPIKTATNVVDRKALPENLDEEADKRKLEEHSANNKPPSSQPNVGDDTGKTRESEAESLSKELRIVSKPKEKESTKIVESGRAKETEQSQDAQQHASSPTDVTEERSKGPPVPIEENTATPAASEILTTADVIQPNSLEEPNTSAENHENLMLESGYENENNNDAKESSSSTTGEKSQRENQNDYGVSKNPNSDAASDSTHDPHITAGSGFLLLDEKETIVAKSVNVHDDDSAADVHNIVADLDVHTDERADDVRDTIPEGDVHNDDEAVDVHNFVTENDVHNIVVEVDVHNVDGANDTEDSPSTKLSIKVSRTTNEGTGESDLDGNRVDIDEAKHEENSTPIADNGSTPFVNSQVDRESDVTVTNSNSLMINVYNTQTAVETGETDTGEKSATVEETGMQDTESKSHTETPDNQHRDANLVEGTTAVKTNDAEKRKDDDEDGELATSLRRTSEDLKINDLKKRVRDGQYFVVKGNSECYDIRWAEKRKVLAYKVGSRNTSRFSTLLTETVEQLERASVRHPSILSEFTRPTSEARRSLLSTYFAGANAKRSIKDNFTREIGTNTEGNENDGRQKSPEYHLWATDQRNQIDARNKSPENNFWAKDHISPGKETFGGVAPKQQTTADSNIQSNNYNYPFLTDYDVNHERKGNK